MQNNTFSDFVKLNVLANSLQSGISYSEIMLTVVEAYRFQERLEIERAEQEIDKFIREFDSITEILLAQIAKFENPDYARIASAINKVVFGRNELGIRQTASSDQLNKLKMFEKILAYTIENGFIKNQTELLLHLQKN